MDQIRNTMMQHEALFKEQVQTLHKLYDIQILAMQETRRRTCSQAQVLTFSSERVILEDDPSNYSILEGKPLRPAYANGRAYKEEYLALSLRPFVTLGEFIGSGSFFMDGVGKETFCTAERKPVRNLDLEKLPEEFMDEPEIHVARSTLSKDTGVISVLGAKLFVTSEQINLNCDQASEGKAFEIDVKKCVTSSLELNSTTEIEQNASEEPSWKHSSPVGSSSMEKPIVQQQGSSILVSGSTAVNVKEVHIDKDNPKDISEGSNSVLSQDSTSWKNENESAFAEDCEILAAEILLSFAPTGKRVDSQFHCTQAKNDDSSNCCRDNETKYPNPGQGEATNDSITWTKSVSRRRTSRRSR